MQQLQINVKSCTLAYLSYVMHIYSVLNTHARWGRLPDGVVAPEPQNRPGVCVFNVTVKRERILQTR